MATTDGLAGVSGARAGGRNGVVSWPLSTTTTAGLRVAVELEKMGGRSKRRRA